MPHIVSIYNLCAHNNLSMLYANYVTVISIISGPMPLEVTGKWSHPHGPLCKGTPLDGHYDDQMVTNYAS
jgi:hypothetical protein